MGDNSNRAKTIQEEFPTLSPKQIESSDKLVQGVIDGKTGLYNAISFINGITKLSETTRRELVGYIVYRVEQRTNKQRKYYNIWGVNIPRVPRLNMKANKSIFTSKVTYLIYIVLAIITLMYAKYKFDILKEERRYELKHQQYRRY